MSHRKMAMNHVNGKVDGNDTQDETSMVGDINIQTQDSHRISIQLRYQLIETLISFEF